MQKRIFLIPLLFLLVLIIASSCGGNGGGSSSQTDPAASGDDQGGSSAGGDDGIDTGGETDDILGDDPTEDLVEVDFPLDPTEEELLAEEADNALLDQGLEAELAATTTPLTENLPTFTRMVSIRAGSFEMGDSSGEGDADESPVHIVQLSAFLISENEITLEEYQAFNPSHENVESTGCDAQICPVTGVSWEEAQQYISWLNSVSPLSSGGVYRLCTEAEWEYAARAGTSTKWSCGADESCLSAAAWYAGNSGDTAQPVRGKAANAFGLYDMHGNVYEWVRDYFDSSYYAISPSTNPVNTNGSERVIRGGDFRDSPRFLRSSYRLLSDPTDSGDNFGLRLCAQ
ncbi:MAG: formylglycine-generating enzyme family protein [SAR324 cluster bacterium]|nr:formylglycine-generating enzyme family protein [SAR324 cluster bacterium]